MQDFFELIYDSDDENNDPFLPISGHYLDIYECKVENWIKSALENPKYNPDYGEDRGIMIKAKPANNKGAYITITDLPIE